MHLTTVATLGFAEGAALGWPLLGIGLGLAVSLTLWVVLSRDRSRREADVSEQLRKALERVKVAESDLAAERRRPGVEESDRGQALRELPAAIRDLSNAKNSAELGDLLGRALSRTLDAGQWMVFIDDSHSGDEYALRASGGEQATSWALGTIAGEQTGRVGLAIRRATALDRHDFESEPPIVRGRLEATEPPCFVVDIAVPLVVGDAVVGVVTIGRPDLPLDIARAVAESLVVAAAAVVRTLDARELANRLENRDELTGLGNRNWFNAQAAELIFRTRDSNVAAAIAIFGVDHLREYAGRHGPGEAGRLLHAVAQAAKPLTRPGDLLARWSDEEFAILLPKTDAVRAQDLVDNVRRKIALLKLPGADTQPTGAFTASAGLAVFPANGMQFEELLESAYRGIYLAREAGGNACVREGAATSVRSQLDPPKVTAVPAAPMAGPHVPGGRRALGLLPDAPPPRPNSFSDDYSDATYLGDSTVDDEAITRVGVDRSRRRDDD